MRKIILTNILIWVFFSLHGETILPATLYNKTSEKIIQIIKLKIPANETVIIDKFVSDPKGNFRNILLEWATSGNAIQIVDFENLAEYQKLALIMQDPSFSEDATPQTGKFSTAKWYIKGHLDYSSKKGFFKIKHSLIFTLTIGEVETGILVSKNTIFEDYTEKPEIYKVFLFIVFTLLVIFAVNYLTKGYHSRLLLATGTAVIILSFIWYFIL